MSDLENSANSQTRISLIGAEEWLVSKLIDLFSAHDISINSFSGADLLNLNPSKITDKSVYKTIWWVDFSQLDLQQQIFELLSSHSPNSLIILGVLPESFLFEKETQHNLEQQQQFFETLVNSFPASQQFFSRDLISNNLPLSPLGFSLRGHQQAVLLDPQDKWYPTTNDSFFKIISPYLTRPISPKRVIVQGKSVMSGEILKRIADLLARYYNFLYEVVPVMAERRSPAKMDFVEAKTKINLTDQLDQFIRGREFWQPLLETLPSPIKGDWQSAKQSEALSDNQAAEDLEKDEFLPLAKTRQKVNSGKRLINQSNNDEISVNRDEQLEGKLSRIFEEKRVEKKSKRIGDKVKIVKKIAKKSQKNKLLFTGGMITMALGGVVLLLWGLLLLSTFLAKKELLSFFDNTSSPINQTYQAGAWSKMLSFQANIYLATIGENWLGESASFINFERSFMEFQREKQTLDGLVAQYLINVMVGADAVPVDSQSLQEQIVLVQQAAAKASGTAGLVLGNTDILEKDWFLELEQQQQKLALASQLPESLDTIFGGEGKRSYAVLLQNNLELRPTGGFLQAIAIFTFDQGLLIDIQTANVYELDERVLASVSAPVEIKKYLGEDNWYLRDGNWNPDFPQTAQRVAWFVRQAVGVQVDGVWALNYYAFEELIDSFDSIEIASFGELLTSNNLLERVEFHSGDELINSGDEKEDYALEVFNQLIQRIRTATPAEATLVVKALENSLDNKQLLVSFFEEDLEETAKLMGWNGEIINPVCPQRFNQGECLVDQVFQVEANTSLNRVGEYIKRSVEHRVDLSGSKVDHTRIVTLKNTTRSDGWPLGTYKTYLRFIIDGEAQPQSLLINGRKITGDQLTIYGDGGRRVVGVLVEVPKETTVTVELSYLTEEIPSGSFSFLLFDQKQSGIADTSTTVTIHNPNSQPVLIAPTAEVIGNSIEFSLIQDDHLFSGASY